MSYSLLSVGGDAKTIKNLKYGYLTGIMYLQPASLSGKNLCPGSSPGCRAACLHYSGRSVAFPKIMEARARKTQLFLKDRTSFMNQLIGDISRLEYEAKKKKFRPVVRLNGTSDIDFSKILVNGKNIFEIFPKVNFMDYTKVARRLFENRHKNYHLTFSLSETNQEIAKTVAAAGFNVAVVFNIDKKNPLPNKFWNKKVICGDDSDLRFLDKKGTIVGLRAKGRARKDKSGFVF